MAAAAAMAAMVVVATAAMVRLRHKAAVTWRIAEMRRRIAELQWLLATVVQEQIALVTTYCDASNFFVCRYFCVVILNSV
jgi:hypothetical protein